MGYNLWIGQAKPVIAMDDRHARMGVEQTSQEGAPESPAIGMGKQNVCWPSYSGFAKFTRAVELERVFYGGSQQCPYYWRDSKGNQQEGLIINHPGCAELTPDHLKAFQDARDRWALKTQDERADWVDSEGKDWAMVRLEWLCWWTAWALKSCSHPSIANS